MFCRILRNLMAIIIIVLILFVHTKYNSLHLGKNLRKTLLIISNKIIQKMPLENTSSSRVSSIYKNVYFNNNTKLCKNGGNLLKVLIIIHSEPSNKQRRSIIRQTWGSYTNRPDIDIGFILGQSPDENIENSLTEENILFGDLIRGQFIDNYNNLTLKSISMLEWVNKKCPYAKFILKTDDDIFINVPNLLQFIDNHRNEKNVIYGCLAKKWEPIRNESSKYYVSLNEFSRKRYPVFTMGQGYLLSSDIIYKLYMKSFENIYLKLEDVFITGLVARQLYINRLHEFRFMNQFVDLDTCIIRKAITIVLTECEQQYEVWTKSLDRTTECN